MALSFKDGKGAQEVWRVIRMILHKDTDENEIETLETDALEKPVLQNLPRINDQIASSAFLLVKKASIAQQCLKDGV